MLFLTFVVFLGTDILVKGRLAILSQLESGQFKTEDDKQETSTFVIFISQQENNISFGVGFAYYSVRQSRATVDNRLKFPRLVFYNGFLLETKEQNQIQLK